MDAGIAERLVPDWLWAVAGPMLPPFSPRTQGGGTTPVDDRKVFTAVVFVLTSGCSWGRLPACFAVATATAHRRYGFWCEAEVWTRLRSAIATSDSDAEKQSWGLAIADAAMARAADTKQSPASLHRRTPSGSEALRQQAAHPAAGQG
ncbi:transposase [Streptomyces roseolus]|uniref:transposase n=1 Tax=Streptomyces roseolus TaxID=67358 RepID=UPI0037BB448C